MLKRWASLAIATLIPGMAALADQPPPLLGVWKGTIGTAEIIACLQPDKDYAVGSYYYLKHLVAIPLGSKDGGASWEEDPDTAKAKDIPIWRVSADGADRATGEWQGKGKTLPIRLTRQPVESDNADFPCGSWAFISPRMQKPVVSEKPMKLDGRDYTQMDVSFGASFSAQLVTFKLAGAGPAVAKINDAIAKLTPLEGTEQTYADCIRGGLAALGRDGDYQVTVKPAFISDRFIALTREDGSFCGGAHPVNALDQFVFDLRSGAAVNTFEWFKPALVDAQYMQFKGALSDAALKAARQHFPPDVLPIDPDSIFSWQVSIRKDGILLAAQVAYAWQAAAAQFVVPFAEMTPYLSPAGQAAVSGMR